MRKARSAEDWPEEPIASDTHFEAGLRRHDPITESRRVIAVRDGEFLGNLILIFRRAGSPDFEEHVPFVNVWGGVLGPHRRQGIGRALLGALHSFMRAEGKTVATLTVHMPDGHACMRAIGATCRHFSTVDHLGLDRLDWNELDRWEAHAARSGLAWEKHAGRVPMERLAQLAAPFSTLFADQPLGTLQRAPVRYEQQDYVTWYADMDRRGGEHFLVLLLDGGEVAAMCDASWNALFPDLVFQALTAVTPKWRGKGLAKGVKAAMLKLIRARHPEARTMITNNADVNEPIRSINQRLGFTVRRRQSVYQIGPDELSRYLGAADKK